MTLYGRNADLLYYFKYVEGNENLFTVYSLILIVPSILGAAVFPFVFEKLGNKLGMAIGTSALAGILGALQFVPNQAQNAAVQTSMHLAFSLIPGVLWLLTAAILFFYRINKRSYNRIMTELNAKKQFEVIKND